MKFSKITQITNLIYQNKTSVVDWQTSYLKSEASCCTAFTICTSAIYKCTHVCIYVRSVYLKRKLIPISGKGKHNCAWIILFQISDLHEFCIELRFSTHWYTETPRWYERNAAEYRFNLFCTFSYRRLTCYSCLVCVSSMITSTHILHVYGWIFQSTLRLYRMAIFILSGLP